MKSFRRVILSLPFSLTALSFLSLLGDVFCEKKSAIRDKRINKITFPSFTEAKAKLTIEVHFEV